MLLPGLASAQSGPYVYVPNHGDNNLSLIDSSTDTVQAGTIAVGTGPYSAAVRGDQALVYVANLASKTVSVIDTATNTVVATINVGNDPHGVTVSPDGRRAYVANSGSNTVSVIDTATNTVLTTVTVGLGPYGVTVSPDGDTVYVANTAGSTVSVIDATSNTVATTITVGTNPYGVAVSPDGSRAYVTNLRDGTVSVIDTASNTVLTTVTVGSAAFGVAVSPDGNRAYVANGGSNTVSVIDTATNTVVTTIAVGIGPAGVTISPDGTRVYVVNNIDKSVSVIDTATNAVIATLAVGTSPDLPGICGNGNALLTTGNTFIAKSAGALGCTGVAGPTFTGGTLQIDTASLTSALSMTLGAAGGTIDTQANTATFSGALTGTGSLTKTGTGTLILSGANTYSGATNINQGTLQAGVANTFSPFSAFSVAGGAVLDLNGFNQTIGSLAGAGNVLLGSAVLTAGGDNASTTFSGVMSGSGGLTKTGTGTFTLSGINTYAGPTAVDGGIVSVNGSIASSSGLTVNAGGTIGGTGILPSTIIMSGGTLAPGNSIGTVTVNGNLTFNGGSTYAVQVSPSDADRTNVSGTATLAGTVNAIFESGSYVTRSYAILSASGGLGGTQFDALTTDNLPAGFTTHLSYSSTDVTLDLAAVLGSGGGLNGNQQNVATALNNYFNGGGALPPGFVTLFGLTGNNLSNGLSQISGEAATGAQQVAFQSMSEFLLLMLDRDLDGQGGPPPPFAFGYASEAAARPDKATRAYAAVLKAPPAKAPSIERRWSVWGSAYGGTNATDGDAAAGTHDLSARTYGGAAGIDYRVSPDTLIGLALSGAGTNWGLAQGLGGGRSDAFLGGLYGRSHIGAAYVAADFAFADHWMTTDRYAFGGDHLTADFNAYSFGGRVEGGYRYELPALAVTPYAALQAQSFHTPDYSETDVTGGGFALSYASRDANDTRSELGVRLARRAAVSRDSVLTLHGRLAWAHDWVSDPALTAAFQSLPGTSFVVDGAVPPEDSALVSAAAKLQFANGVSFMPKFDGDFADGSQTYAGTGTLRYTW